MNEMAGKYRQEVSYSEPITAQPAMSDAQRELDQALAKLRATAECLRQRLDAVLRPAAPVGGAGGGAISVAPTEGASPLVVMTRGSANAVREVADLLQDALTRLEV